MYMKRSTTVRYFLATLVAAIIHAEWLIYYIQPVFWQSHECDVKDSSCTKILFIADPEIRGETSIRDPLSYILNWDSDRYLMATFNAVLSYFKPDVLVFLGDLMSNDTGRDIPEYLNNIYRLGQIFDVNDKILRIWVLGDNDIGQENYYLYDEQIQEFQKVFPQSAEVRFRNITFYKVDFFTGRYPRLSDANNTLKIVVSHHPVLLREELSIDVEQALKPNIYFCGHEHESKYMVQSPDRSQQDVSYLTFPRMVLDFTFNEGLQYEVYVPTCSYRAGTGYIGYGAALVENNHLNMRYTVFWSSSRFPYIMFYVLIILVLIVYCLVYCFARFRNENDKTLCVEMAPLMQPM